MPDIGRNEANILNKEILNTVKAIVGKMSVQARLFGLDYLMDTSHKQSIHNMIIGHLLAVLLVGLCLVAVYRNVILLLLTLLLNMIPIVITAGVLGFTNLELRGEISLLFTIGFVIAVDNTIHLLSKFQWERKRGRSVSEAVEIAL